MPRAGKWLLDLAAITSLCALLALIGQRIAGAEWHYKWASPVSICVNGMTTTVTGPGRWTEMDSYDWIYYNRRTGSTIQIRYRTLVTLALSITVGFSIGSFFAHRRRI